VVATPEQQVSQKGFYGPKEADKGNQTPGIYMCTYTQVPEPCGEMGVGTDRLLANSRLTPRKLKAGLKSPRPQR
jgi:hypothetical protein